MLSVVRPLRPVRTVQRPRSRLAVRFHLRVLGWPRTRRRGIVLLPQRKKSMSLELTPDDVGLAFQWLMTGEEPLNLPEQLQTLGQEDWVALERLMWHLLQQKSWSSLH